MRIAALAAILLTSCSHTVTLNPRGGGAQQGTGALNNGSKSMQVVLHGETYRGRYVLGDVIGVLSSYGAGVATGTPVPDGNQASALLASTKGAVIRCDLVLQSISGGYGVCADSQNRVYDVLIKPE